MMFIVANLKHTTQPRLLYVSLKCISSIFNYEKYHRAYGVENEIKLAFQENGGVDMLEDFVDHKNVQIYDTSCQILLKHFGASENSRDFINKSD